MITSIPMEMIWILISILLVVYIYTLALIALEIAHMITLGNESYYINSRVKSRSFREQIMCFYYILVTFCINIHFSWVLISFV